MDPVISIAANGLAAQSQRIEAVAQVVAALGATAPAGTTEAASSAPVSIGALPVGDPLESLVTLTEAEIAYRANAVVLETAVDMLDTLLDTLDAQSGQS